ncbi:MAG TPA: hypothetical protein VLA13_07420 [Massilibacterium sp.]|nr:hypothetical protein [Massilibacterium sp.]
MNTECQCSNWCRSEPQPITDKHHIDCPNYNEEIRVIKITYNGVAVYDVDINGALQSIIDGDDYTYEVKFMKMLKRDYYALPEFKGF